MLYKCELCNYKTNDSSNFCRHKKQKKHLKKVEAEIENDKIKKNYEELKIKLIENDFEKKLIEKEKETEKKLLEKDFEMKLMEKEKEKLAEVNKILIENTGKTINNNNNNTQNNNINIGTLNYINEHFKNAPPLEKISNFVINGIDTNDEKQYDKFISNLIYHHNNKNLHVYLGDHIVSIYKKKNLNEQSIHTTDTSRLNYAIRIIEESLDLYDTSEEDIDNYTLSDKDDSEIDSDEEELKQIKEEYYKKLKEKNLKNIKKKNAKIWIVDKSGYKICRIVVEPIIRRMLRILRKNLRDRNKLIITDLDEELKYRSNVNSMIDSIDTKKLKNDINKYIAPKFNLDKKN